MARILVAEDEESVREMLVRTLESRGHEVSAVRDGMAALGAFDGEAFDLLISDIVMPELDGIQLALRVSRDHPEMKIVLISGYTEAQQKARNLEALVHGVIAKPFSLQEICGAVDDALATA